MRTDTHERFDREDEVRPSSDRAFGLVFATFFWLIGLWPLVGGGVIRWWSVALGGIFLAFAVGRPRTLAPLNRAWLKVGLLLHAVVGPAVMALLFFGTVAPLAVLHRLCGKDPLRLRLDPDAPTYWIDRQPPGPSPESMSRQF